MTRLFVYGTLMDPQQMALVCGMQYGEEVESAGERVLEDWEWHREGEIAFYPTITPKRGASVKGVLYRVSPEHIVRLDVYEGVPSLYLRRVVELEDGPAFAYVQNERWHP